MTEETTPTGEQVTLTGNECEYLGQAFWGVRKHSPAGANYPVGQLDGDCRACGEQWPLRHHSPRLRAAHRTTPAAR